MTESLWMPDYIAVIKYKFLTLSRCVLYISLQMIMINTKKKKKKKRKKKKTLIDLKHLCFAWHFVMLGILKAVETFKHSVAYHIKISPNCCWWKKP